YDHIPRTPERSSGVSIPYGANASGIPTPVERLHGGLRPTVSQGPHLSRPTPPTVRRWRPQGSFALSGAEAAVPLGLSQDVSAPGPHGRTLWPEPTGRELLDPSVVARLARCSR